MFYGIARRDSRSSFFSSNGNSNDDSLRLICHRIKSISMNDKFQELEFDPFTDTQIDQILIKRQIKTVRRVYLSNNSRSNNGLSIYKIGWVVDCDVSSCMICMSSFNLFRFRHHCRACGLLVCDNCSPYKTNIINFTEVGGSRVCNNCFGLRNEKIIVSTSFLSPSDVKEVKPITPNGIVNTSFVKRRNKAAERNSFDRKIIEENQKFEVSQIPKYKDCYLRMRQLIPINLLKTKLSDMIEIQCIDDLLAHRIWHTKALWLIVMHPDDILKVHISDLRGKYSPIGLDITEMRAIYYNLPVWNEENDITGQKKEWILNYKQKLDELNHKELFGTLSESETRNKVYDNLENVIYFESDVAIESRYHSAPSIYRQVQKSNHDSISSEYSSDDIVNNGSDSSDSHIQSNNSYRNEYKYENSLKESPNKSESLNDTTLLTPIIDKIDKEIISSPTTDEKYASILKTTERKKYIKKIEFHDNTTPLLSVLNVENNDKIDSINNIVDNIDLKWASDSPLDNLNNLNISSDVINMINKDSNKINSNEEINLNNDNDFIDLPIASTKQNINRDLSDEYDSNIKPFSNSPNTIRIGTGNKTASSNNSSKRISRTSSINISSNRKFSILVNALSSGKAEEARALINNGCINLSRGEATSILLRCIEDPQVLQEPLETITLLVIQFNADVNTVDSQFKTPIMSLFTNPLLGRFIILNGGDILSYDDQGSCALSLTFEYGIEWMLEIFESSGLKDSLLKSGDIIRIRRYVYCLIFGGYASRVNDILSLNLIEISSNDATELWANSIDNVENMKEPVEIFELLEKYGAKMHD
jgi:hypothetical protein